MTDEFFLRTAASIETAYVRPRYPCYVGLQERAGEAIVEYSRDHGNTQKALEQIDALYRASQSEGIPHV